MNLNNYFNNEFDSGRISDSAMRLFTEDHLKRLAKQDKTGQYTCLVNATTDAYQDYFGAMVAEDARYAVQQSLTQTVHAVYEEFKEAARQQEGLIRSIWGKDSPEYQEFYPLGLTEISEVGVGDVEGLMRRFVQNAEARATELGEEFVDRFRDILQRFVAARSAQLEKFAEVRDSKTETASSRDDLEKQLMYNLLTIARDHIGKPEILKDFFNQSIL